ncbi:MAG: hypothetical protein H6698_07095 [Myxococcales bacterium]|nr:hypothetical protein [Myxococcales bacterium]MCB9534073.1 hypothetical protein [Myxococcales bacterium]
MTNGANSWGVGYSHISWMTNVLSTHNNVREVTRVHDIVFEVERIRPEDRLRILLVNEYVMGLTRVQSALAEFGALNIICVGGKWNGYTKDAEAFCRDQRIGLFATPALVGALNVLCYWNHRERDRGRNPRSHGRRA